MDHHRTDPGLTRACAVTRPDLPTTVTTRKVKICELELQFRPQSRLLQAPQSRLISNSVIGITKLDFEGDGTSCEWLCESSRQWHWSELGRRHSWHKRGGDISVCSAPIVLARHARPPCMSPLLPPVFRAAVHPGDVQDLLALLRCGAARGRPAPIPCPIKPGTLPRATADCR